MVDNDIAVPSSVILAFPCLLRVRVRVRVGKAVNMSSKHFNWYQLSIQWLRRSWALTHFAVDFGGKYLMMM